MLQLGEAKKEMLSVEPVPDERTARRAYVEKWEFKKKGPRTDFGFRAMVSVVEELAVLKTIDHAALSGFPIKKTCAAAAALAFPSPSPHGLPSPPCTQRGARPHLLSGPCGGPADRPAHERALRRERLVGEALLAAQ